MLLFAGFKLESRNGWLACLSVMALISIPAWLSALKRLRAVRDTPTSRVASAAQGYVELTGRGQPFGDIPLLGRLTQLPCLWYRYKIEQRTSRNKWQTIYNGKIDNTSIMLYETVMSVYIPKQAEIITRH